MLAALGVFGTGSAWPDLAMATVMAVLAVGAGVSVVWQARDELRADAQPKAPAQRSVHRHAE